MMYANIFTFLVLRQICCGCWTAGYNVDLSKKQYDITTVTIHHHITEIRGQV